MALNSFIAGRFLVSRGNSNFVSFITLISIAGVAIGVTALIIAVSILNGFEKEITEKTISIAAHIQITSHKQSGISDYQYAVNHLTDTSNHLDIVSIHPYVQHEAVIKFKDKTEGIVLKGVRNEDNIFANQRKIISGSGILDSKDTNLIPVIIGNKLAMKLGISVNSKVFIIATNGIPSPMNPPNVKPFKVTGIYESGLKEYDDVLLYSDLKDIQRLFSMGSNITGLEVMLKDAGKITETEDKISKILGYPFYPKSIFEIYDGLFKWVKLQKKPIPIVLGLIIIVAAFNIIGFLLMIVLEKTEEIGILKSLGAGSIDVVKIFFYQGMLISVIGIILGNIFGYGLCFLQLKLDIIRIPDLYYMSKVPILLDWQTGFIITGLTILLSVLVTIIPSYLASKLNPITSLRFK